MMEMCAETNVAAMAADATCPVTTAEFIFSQVRNVEYLVRVEMSEAQETAGKKLHGHVHIAVSTFLASMHTIRTRVMSKPVRHRQIT